MDAVKDLPEQDSAEMRQEIDATRSAMANKLEALEDKVMHTVQSAKDTVKDSLQSAKDTVASVKQTFDLKHQVEQRPWTMVGGCFLAGLAVGHLMPRGRPQSSVPPSGPAQMATMPRRSPRYAACRPRRRVELASWNHSGRDREGQGDRHRFCHGAGARLDQGVRAANGVED